jgi:hypothetical protein
VYSSTHGWITRRTVSVFIFPTAAPDRGKTITVKPRKCLLLDFISFLSLCIYTYCSCHFTLFLMLWATLWQMVRTCSGKGVQEGVPKSLARCDGALHQPVSSPAPPMPLVSLEQLLASQNAIMQRLVQARRLVNEWGETCSYSPSLLAIIKHLERVKQRVTWNISGSKLFDKLFKPLVWLSIDFS